MTFNTFLTTVVACVLISRTGWASDDANPAANPATTPAPAHAETPAPASAPNPAPTSDPDCPTGCTCQQAYSKLICRKINRVPDFQNKSLVKSLTISFNNNTELGVDTLAGFIGLVHLELANANIYKLHKDAFNDFKATVTMINLHTNKITSMHANTFHDFPRLNKLDLSDNSAMNVIGNNSFVNLPALQLLMLAACGLKRIEAGAFQDVPALEVIYLGDNHLTEIPFAALKSLLSLKVLVMNFNQIDGVPAVTLSVLPNLEEIDLDSNPLTFVTFPNVSPSLKTLHLGYTALKTVTADTWKHVKTLETLSLSGLKVKEIHREMFHGLSKLQKLFLRSSHNITTVGEYAFQELSSLKWIDLSSNHKLTSVHVTAFRNTSLKTLFLDNTALTTFQADLAPWPTMEKINFDATPLICDCHIRWMLDTNITGTYKTVTDRMKSIKCKSPPLLADKTVKSLPLKVLTCNNRGVVGSSSSRTVTGLVVAAICTVTMLTIMLLVKCRKRIIMSVRGYFEYRRYRNDLVFMVENDTAVGELEDSDGRPMKEMRLETVPLTD